jgi:hypothetical protein
MVTASHHSTERECCRRSTYSVIVKQLPYFSKCAVFKIVKFLNKTKSHNFEASSTLRVMWNALKIQR